MRLQNEMQTKTKIWKCGCLWTSNKKCKPKIKNKHALIVSTCACICVSNQNQQASPESFFVCVECDMCEKKCANVCVEIKCKPKQKTMRVVVYMKHTHAHTHAFCVRKCSRLKASSYWWLKNRLTVHSTNNTRFSLAHFSGADPCFVSCTNANHAISSHTT